MICDESRVIFIHMPRTGGTSIELGLTGKNWWDVDPPTKHLTCTRAKQVYANRWDDYLKVAVVRNPWDWTVSLFHSHHSVRSGNGHISWADYVKNPRLMAHEQNTVIQSEIIGNEIDYVLKFENLSQDFETLCTMLGIRRELPKFDAHSGRLEEKFRHYSEYYDEVLREIIANRHEADIKRFNYSFQYP